MRFEVPQRIALAVGTTVIFPGAGVAKVIITITILPKNAFII